MVVPNDSTVIAHAGDGNFHTVILFDPNKEEHRNEAERLNHLMVRTALGMEGTCYLSIIHFYSICQLWFLTHRCSFIYDPYAMSVSVTTVQEHVPANTALVRGK